MQGKRRSRCVLRVLPAFASLLAMLVVPMLHGSLSHAHADCGSDAARASCLDPGRPPDVSAGPADCSVCLASGRTRAVVATAVDSRVALPAQERRFVAPAARPRAVRGLAAPAAPRAPPTCV